VKIKKMGSINHPIITNSPKIKIKISQNKPVRIVKLLTTVPMALETALKLKASRYLCRSNPVP